MGSGVGSIRVGRAVGEALLSRRVTSGSSEGVGGQKRPTAERDLVSGTVGVW